MIKACFIVLATACCCSCAGKSESPVSDSKSLPKSNSKTVDKPSSQPPTALSRKSTPASKPTELIFQGKKYFHRFSKNDLHEFTPEGQDDLSKWSDMVSINCYRQVLSAEQLAATANGVLENYKRNRAKVLKTDSVPRTKDKPAEHLIVVIFGRPNFIEAVQARFKLVNGIGMSVIHSHRVNGMKVGPEMSAWLEKNRPLIERDLLAWDAFPSPAALKTLKQD